MSIRPDQLRVALLASSLRLGGAEKQTAYMARALHEAGPDVRLYYLGAGGHYETYLRERGVPVHPIFVRNRPAQILFRLTREWRRWRPHIVLVCQFGDLRFGAVAGRLCQALTVGGVRSDGWYELRTHALVARHLLRALHGVVTNSHRAKDTLIGQGFNSSKLAVLKNVIDLEEFDACRARPFARPLPFGRVIAAAVGSLHQNKRFDRFLEALAVARRSSPQLMGVVAGADAGAKAGLEERAGELGLGPEDFVLLGETGDVPALLARSAMLVLTSDYEGFPNVILEAMAARLPVITTPAGDAGLIVKHGETGYVVEWQDTAKMAQHMVALAKSPERRASFGEAARGHIEQSYNYRSLAGQLLSVLHRFAYFHRRIALGDLLEESLPEAHLGPATGSIRAASPTTPIPCAISRD